MVDLIWQEIDIQIIAMCCKHMYRTKFISMYTLFVGYMDEE